MTTPFKARLREGKALFGTLVTLPLPGIAEMFAELGYDWLWLDMEHTALELADVQNLIMATGGRCASLVRVPWNDPVWIKRVLDLGSDGVIIPQVRSAEEARAAVAACHYPPQGIRSVGIGRAQSYGGKLREYVERTASEIAVLLQVEHILGVENIEEIVATPGVDAIILGPFDLSASMGLTGQVQRPEVQEALQRVKTVCQRAKMPYGLFTVETSIARAERDAGATLIAHCTDALHLWRAAQTALSKMREGGC